MIRRAIRLLVQHGQPMIFAGPLAFFATGCFSEAWTPAVSVEQGTNVPAPIVTPLPAYDAAVERWALPQDNPWAPFQKMTLLSSLTTPDAQSYGAAQLPNVRELDVVRRAEATAGHVAASLPVRTAFIVDMRGAASVAFGAELRRLGAPVSCVLTFNNWPADDEMVPAEETLAALLDFSSDLPEPKGATIPVFLLDAWRLAYRTDETADDVMDNRYMLTSADLPDAATLKKRGIDSIVYLVESTDDTQYEEDDLHEMFLAYQAAGVHLSIMGLDELSGMDLTAGFPMEEPEDLYYVEPRVTIVNDWRFYRRAHGGFGGIHGAPAYGGHGGHGTVTIAGGYSFGGGHGFSFGHGGG